MAYKYKLVKELGPQDFERIAGITGPDTMDAISKGYLNDYDLNDLEQILGQAGVEQEKIRHILRLWMDRPKDVGLNEKEEGYYEDPETKELKKGSFEKAFDAKMRHMFGKPNPNIKNTFKTPEEQGKEKLTQEVLRRLKNR